MKRPLSIGDAIALAALCIFAAAWVAGWFFLPNWQDTSSKSRDEAAWLIFAIMFGPPIFAGYLAYRIVDR